MSASLPVLYSFRRCPYAMRARWALLLSGQTVELREVALKSKPAEMLAASPKGTVPVLLTSDGAVIEESLDIMLWALHQHDPWHYLAPPGGSLAEMLALIAGCDGDFKTNLDRYKYPQRYANADPLAHRAAAAKFLLGLDQRLGRQACLFGPVPSLADIAIAPFVRQFALTDSGWFAQQAWPRLQQWLAARLATPEFGVVMSTFAPWQPDAPPVRFPPAA